MQKGVRRVPILEEALLQHELLLLAVHRTRNVMHSLEFGPWEGVEHVGHPLPLDGFDRMVHSWPAGLEGFPTQLVPQSGKGRHNFLLGHAPQRNVLEIAVDVCAGDEGMMIALDDEIKLDVLVLLHEAFEGRRDQGVADA